MGTKVPLFPSIAFLSCIAESSFYSLKRTPRKAFCSCPAKSQSGKPTRKMNGVRSNAWSPNAARA